jgi:hypothetical protein
MELEKEFSIELRHRRSQGHKLRDLEARNELLAENNTAAIVVLVVFGLLLTVMAIKVIFS